MRPLVGDVLIVNGTGEEVAGDTAFLGRRAGVTTNVCCLDEGNKNSGSCSGFDSVSSSRDRDCLSLGAENS